MDDFKDRLLEQSQDIKEIKHHVIELVKQGAVHNQVLTQHEQRSTTLERMFEKHQRDADARIKPLEQAYQFRAAIKTLLLGSSGLISFILALLAIYLKTAK